MLVSEIIQATNGILISGNLTDDIRGFTQDSRKVNVGDMYIPLVGEKFDGHDFIQNAFDAGALAIITSKLDHYPKDKIVIQVENTLIAMQSMAKYLREHRDVIVVAITGSVGKTSTKDMVASVLSTKFKTLKTKGNYNNHIGLPLTILNYHDEEVLVLEMGMNNLGEISLLSKIARPNYAIITNIGTAHIGNLGSQENILKAKLEILDGMQEDGVLIINNDNELLYQYGINHPVVTYGIQKDSNYSPTSLKTLPHLSTYEYQHHMIDVLVPGDHFVLNSLASLAIGDLMGIEIDDIKQGIKSFQLTQNRMDFNHLQNNMILIDGTYNANYDSMVSSINVLTKYPNRKVVILADMLELGDFSEELHRSVGFELASKNIDIIIGVGKEARFMIDSARRNGAKNLFHFVDNTQLLQKIDSILNANDVILVKGSQGMHLLEVVDYLKQRYGI